MSAKVSQPELKKYMDKRVLIHLQAGRKVTGSLRGFDIFLNLVLDDSLDESFTGQKINIGQVVIRGNSVMSMESLEALPGSSNYTRLTLGILSLDDLNLKVLETSGGSEVEREHARRLLNLLSCGRHWILSVLLLSNSIVNEALPIFLDSILGGGYSAIILSTASIFIFGEIIPQSICARHGLAIGSFFAPLVLLLCYVTSPITYPLSKVLDHLLGSQHDTTYKKAELKSFLNLHRYGVEPLQDDEINIMEACLSLNEKKVRDIMTPIEDVYTLPSDQIVDEHVIDKILHHGYSRIPIHEPENPTKFVGMLLVKKLIKYDPEDKWLVSDFSLSVLPEALPTISCFQALDYFQTGRAHLLVITDLPGDSQGRGVLGVATLEDVLEEILGEEIIDESDRIMDNRTKRRVVRTHQYIKGIYERQKAVRNSGSIPDSPANNLRKIENRKYGTSNPISPGHSRESSTFSTPANMTSMTSEEGVETLNLNEGSSLINNNSNKNNKGSRYSGLLIGTPPPAQKRFNDVNYGSL